MYRHTVSTLRLCQSTIVFPSEFCSHAFTSARPSALRRRPNQSPSTSDRRRRRWLREAGESNRGECAPQWQYQARTSYGRALILSDRLILRDRLLERRFVSATVLPFIYARLRFPPPAPSGR